VKRLAGLAVLVLAGCSGFDQPRPDRLEGLGLRPDYTASRPPPSGSTFTRCRFRMSVDSPWLAGEFDGIVLAEQSFVERRLRAQLFGDLGPKMADLAVGRNRIVGFLPQTRQGVDCTVPGEETPHLLLLMGEPLFEEFCCEVTPSRVTGIREESGGAWLRLGSTMAGVEAHFFADRTRRETKKRRYWWMTGVHWEEEWTDPSTCRITAPHLTIRVSIVERTPVKPDHPEAIELALPADVRIVAGSRK